MGPRLDTDGYAIVGTLDDPTVATLTAAARRVSEAHGRAGEALHLLSAIGRDPSFTTLLGWPPLLEVAVDELSPNIYVHHSHLDVHPPAPSDGRLRWHRDGGVQGREMHLMPGLQPRLALKAGVFLSAIDEPEDGAIELVPGSHLDLVGRATDDVPDDAVRLCCPAGTVALFDTRLWHRRGDNVGPSTRIALFFTYTYRWIGPRDIVDTVDPPWEERTPLERQLLGDRTWDGFYPPPDALPVARWRQSRGLV